MKRVLSDYNMSGDTRTTGRRPGSRAKRENKVPGPDRLTYFLKIGFYAVT